MIVGCKTMKKTEDRLEALRALRALSDEQADPELRKALQDRSNLVVAEAAKTIAARHRTSLVPDLLIALDRLFEEPVKSDSKCWGKIAIIKALAALDYDQSPPFVRASAHIQMEPVWGGQEDAATHLRAHAVLALVQCSDLTRPEILRRVVDAMVDKSDTVRIEAIRTVEQLNGEEGALLLRLKAYSGDERSSVVGQVFDSIFALERDKAVPFVAQFLSSPLEETRDEAALSLGASRLPAAVAELISVWKKSSRNREFSTVLLRALSSSRDEEALQFLLGLVREGLSRDAQDAIEALGLHRDSEEIQARTEQAKMQRQTSRSE
jgi:HEAT repeat protein